MDLSLTGKTAVVVGGTLGIGRALAIGLAAAEIGRASCRERV